MSEVVQVIRSEHEGVVEVRLNRPDKMNSLNTDMFTSLAAVGEELKKDPGLRAVVLSGEGRCFCAGLDMGNFSKMAEGGGAGVNGNGLEPRTHGDSNLAQYVAMVWREVPVPVIAAVHGVCFGGGLQVALGADMRYTTPDAQWAVLEVKWGLVPDMGGMVLLNELVRPDIARELCYSGRVLNGSEAVELGLATHLGDDPRADALALARTIAGKNPDAIRAMKRMLNSAITPREEAARILLEESREQDRIIGSPNQVEAVYANLEKRAPKFADPEV
ncbi:Enoyl-CoA hydratase/carnithine racemase [Marinobacter daqiaonensis]|uniref:Enoyl-CoA hydratase/carnithine racemase n=1 Tax=Marinobacter daqiaonensis TaxID=650891 RepID=A0A1I6IME2_9GAMM|nr:crotonase/enoyl-CoA hydratase family protein [Marinobacter daqiaonensis]SFR67886.1 Enoyl-CoA hydratase/carnithine racemase [Marinobacter daqiaonensis]